MGSRPRAVVVTAVAFTSLSAILIRLSTAHPIAISAYRMLFSFAMIAPFAVKGWTALSRRDLLLAAASGAFLALHFAAWITAVTMTTVAAATVLVSTHPIVVLLGSALFLGQKPVKGSVGLVLVAVGGAALLSIGDSNAGNGDTAGNMLALLGAVAVAGYMVIGSSLRRRVGALQYNSMVYGVAGVLLLTGSVLSGVPLKGYGMREFVIFLSLAFFCTILGHTLFNWALKYVRATFVSTSILLEPIFATVMALFVLNEIPSPVTLVGGVVIIGALRGVARREGQAAMEVTG